MSIKEKSTLSPVMSWFDIFSFGELATWELTASSFSFRGADKESPESSSRFAVFSKYCLVFALYCVVFCLVSVER